MPPDAIITHERMMNILRSLVNSLVNLEVVGGENIPEQGAYVLTTSHISRLDTPFLMLSTSRQDVSGMVAKEYERTVLFGWILKKLNVIWINREGYDFEAFRKASTFLKKGGVVGLAPEGKRSKDGQLMEGKPGAVLLALKNRVPIIPAAVIGSADMLKRFSKFAKMQVKVIFGKPFVLPHLGEGQTQKEYLDSGVTEVMCQIAALLPEERRGFYRDHPRLRVLLDEQQA